MPSSITSAPAAHARLADRAATRRASGSRPSRRASARRACRARGERVGDPLDAARRRACSRRRPPASTSARSLSPRPDRHTRSSSPSRLREHPGERVRGLERRDDALQARELAERGERLRVGHRDVARAAAVAQVGVLGPGARDSRGRRRSSAPRGSGPPRPASPPSASRAGCPARPPTVSGAPWRRVSMPSPPASTPISSTSLVVEERGEDADRVRAAADAGDHARGQPPLALEHLRARLVADHALQVAHERRVGRRPDDRADHVVRALRRSRPSRGSPPRSPP